MGRRHEEPQQEPSGDGSASTPLVGAIDTFLAWMVDTKGRTPNTAYKYGQTYKALVRHLGAQRSPASIDTEELEGFLHRRRPRCNTPAPATVKREIMELRALFKWLGAREQLRLDPTLRLLESAPRIHNENPRPADQRAWRRLWFGQLEDHERAAFGLAYFCGLRRQEVALLSPEQVTDDVLVGMRRKGGKRVVLRWRTSVQLYESRLPELIGGADLFVGALMRTRDLRSDRPALLPWADERLGPVTRQLHAMPDGMVNPDLFNKRLRRALRRNGMALDSFTPHQLRHGFCTNLISVGVPIEVVSKLAGHASLDVTMRYVDLGDDPLRSFVDAPQGDTPRLVNRFGG